MTDDFYTNLIYIPELGKPDDLEKREIKIGESISLDNDSDFWGDTGKWVSGNPDIIELKNDNNNKTVVKGIKAGKAYIFYGLGRDYIGSWFPFSFFKGFAPKNESKSYMIEITVKEKEDNPTSFEYHNTKGDGAVYAAQSGAPLEFVFKRSVDDDKTFSHFTGVNVDGKALNDADYTASEGSVNVKLQPEFLEILAVGGHDLTALFDDGNDVTVKFTITENIEEGGESSEQTDITSEEQTGESTEENGSDNNTEAENKSAKGNAAEDNTAKSSVRPAANSSNTAGIKNVSAAPVSNTATSVLTTASSGTAATTASPATGGKNNTPIWIAAVSAAATALAGVIVRRKKTEDK